MLACDPGAANIILTAILKYMLVEGMPKLKMTKMTKIVAYSAVFYKGDLMLKAIR